MTAAAGGPTAIRTASPTDLPALADLMADSPLLRRYGTSRESALASLREGLREGDLLLVLAPPETGSRVVGVAWLQHTRALGGGAYLKLLLLAEGAQGRQQGARLLAAAEDHARQAWATSHLYLLATADNAAARRFYERHGYRYVGLLPELVRPGLDEALYHKRLRPHGRLPPRVERSGG